MGKVSLYLHPKTEDRLLDRIMEADKCSFKSLSMSEVVRKHLEYAFKAPITEVMKDE